MLEAQLDRLALAGRGLEALAAAIGSFLGRAVASRAGAATPLAVHAPADVPRAAAAVTRYLARSAAAAPLPLRVPLPAAPGESGDAGGRLVLLGDAPASELERIAAARIAGLLALELARDAAVRQARDEARRARGPLPADGPPWVVLVARQAQRRRASRHRRPRGDPGRAPPPRLAAPAGPARDEREPRAADGRRAVADDPDGLEHRRPDGGVPRADRGGLAAVRRARPDGPPRRRARGPRSRRSSCSTSRPRVARADRLPAYRLLGNLHNLPDGQRQARALLEPLLVGRAGDAAPSGWRRSARSSTSRGSPRPPPRSGSIATPSPTGSGGSRPRPAGGLADPDLAVRAGARRQTCAR